MSVLREIREYIEAIEKLIFEQRLNKENKRVARVLLHIRTAKEILEYEDNPRIHSRWYIILLKDYDRLCSVVFENLKKRQQQAQARQEVREHQQLDA